MANGGEQAGCQLILGECDQPIGDARPDAALGQRHAAGMRRAQHRTEAAREIELGGDQQRRAELRVRPCQVRRLGRIKPGL
jgi:hypothetical protein